MKKNSILFIIIILVFSCNKSSNISKIMHCKKTIYNNLEVVNDVYKKFSVQLPKNWKTNLYYDNKQSSIYSADTTKQLTETFLVDVTLIQNKFILDSNFLNNYKNQLAQEKLIESSFFETTFLEKDTYFSRVLGTKDGFPYQMINLFIKINNTSHIHAKTEVYGDSLTNERLCNAIRLIEKITFLQNDK